MLHNRYDKVLQLIPDTLDWCASRDISVVRDFLLDKDGLPRIFLGSGGSLSAAQLAVQLSVSHGIFATAMTPYQYVCSDWSKLPAKVFAFSAGGRNIDVINAYHASLQNSCQLFSAMLMSTSTLLENMMVENGNRPFAYDLKNGDGFLATNSLVAFYALLFKIYMGKDISINDWSFISRLENDIDTFISGTYNLATDEWDEHDAALYGARETDRFYVLFSPDITPVAIDLESRFSEGSIGCMQISDYRNFAHGRFNWFHQRKGQTGIIALITPDSHYVAESILSELPDYIPVMKLSTDKSGENAIMELLLKGMYLSKYLGRRWGLDIGAPQVAQFGKIIHRKDFIDKQNKEENDVIETVDLPLIDNSIIDLPIANISRVNGNIIRGETLWASRNRKYIKAIKDAGIDIIIDFRTADYTDKYAQLCSSAGLEYSHFPIDKANTPDSELIHFLPELFDMLDNRRCYISCQQGLHRTDIALAIYYMFHRPGFVPVLSGHFRNGDFRCDDIMRRLNSIYKAMTPADKELLGLAGLNDEEYRHRRKWLLEKNRGFSKQI